MTPEARVLCFSAAFHSYGSGIGRQQCVSSCIQRYRRAYHSWHIPSIILGTVLVLLALRYLLAVAAPARRFWDRRHSGQAAASVWTSRSLKHYVQDQQQLQGAAGNLLGANRPVLSSWGMQIWAAHSGVDTNLRIIANGCAGVHRRRAAEPAPGLADPV
jgi:hypothetical protein